MILVNVGDGYADPIHYTGRGRAGTDGEYAPGQLLIHELVHAWQIANESFTPEYYCRALSAAGGTVGGDMSAYVYGSADGGWGSFETEAQAKLVDEWFAGNTPSPRAARAPIHRSPRMTSLPIEIPTTATSRTTFERASP